MSSFPNFKDKHAYDGMVSPRDVVSYVLDDPQLVVPDAVILTYQRIITLHLESAGVRSLDGYPGPWRKLYLIEEAGLTVGVVGGFGVGASVAAMVLEDLAAMGIRRFLSIGGAGTLQSDCNFGEIVVCTGAIRDEGVSHHYLAPAKFSYPSEALTRQFTDTLRGRGMDPRTGATWTIDAPYRETIPEVRAYQAEGVVSVEMEAAALFAVGGYRELEVAAAFVITDTLAGDRWTNAFGTDAIRVASIGLLDAAVETLLEREPNPP